MKKIFSFKLFFSLAIVGSLILAGCQKEEMATAGGAPTVDNHKRVKLSASQQRDVKDMHSRMPKVRYWDEVRHRFIEMATDGSRDLVFTDPDEGFNFTDPDGNGVMVFSDVTGDYFVFTSGIGVAGNGGGGTVVVGSSSLNIDITLCFSAEAVQAGDGNSFDIFNSGFTFTEYAAVFGIAGDFEGLQDADSGSDDFDPFEFFQGFAVFYVMSDDISGSHDVFDWMDSEGEDEGDFDDLASAFVMDFSTFSVYFATNGTITVNGGNMTFNGEFLALEDLFESFIDDDGLEGEDIEASVVSGFGTMGCN